MSEATATLARSITKNGSSQTYFTALLMVDKDLVDDFFRAYAYFRWADDVIDDADLSHEERLAFAQRQGELIDGLFRNDTLGDLADEEEILRDLIRNSREGKGGLESFIRNMYAVIGFDARRKGRLVSQEELDWYTDVLGVSVIDGIQYFVGHDHPYPRTENQYLAGMAAHIAHMLRDAVEDTADGFINIPQEYLEEHGIGAEDFDSLPFRAWVRARVEQARSGFLEGKRYIDQLDVLRCKIVAHWYCARFEGILDRIERDGFILRQDYKHRRKLGNWLRIAWVAAAVTLRHVAGGIGPRRPARLP